MVVSKGVWVEGVGRSHAYGVIVLGGDRLVKLGLARIVLLVEALGDIVLGNNGVGI